MYIFWMTMLSAAKAALQMSSNEASSVTRGQSSVRIFGNKPRNKILSLTSSRMRFTSLINASVCPLSHDVDEELPFGFFAGPYIPSNKLLILAINDCVRCSGPCLRFCRQCLSCSISASLRNRAINAAFHTLYSRFPLLSMYSLNHSAASSFKRSEKYRTFCSSSHSFR